jgi:hypothetical protein
MSDNKKSPAPDVARSRAQEFTPDEVVMLSTGYRARVKPVPASLLDAVTARVVEPSPPMQFVESKGRDEPNPFAPEYLKGLEAANRERGLATIAALLMFGIDLVDGLPPLEEWLPRLNYMVRRGMLDLSKYDLQDEYDREYVFKAYVAVAQPDINRLMIACGLLQEEVRAAVKGFPGS